MNLSLGMGGDTAAPGAAAALAGGTSAGLAPAPGLGVAPEVGTELQGLTPVEAGKQVVGQIQSTFDEVKGKAKQALSTENIGSVDASTQAAAAGIQNPDKATADAIRGAFNGGMELAKTGAKNLIGDAAGAISGGAPMPGRLEKSLEGGFQNLLTFMAPQVPVKEAMAMAKDLGQTKA